MIDNWIMGADILLLYTNKKISHAEYIKRTAIRTQTVLGLSVIVMMTTVTAFMILHIKG